MDITAKEDRYERWVKVSIGLARFDPFLVSLVLHIGQMDTNLWEFDATLVEKYKADGYVNEDYDAIVDHLTNSYLWVLGAYEIVRTLTERIRDQQSDDPPEVLQRFKAARARFARLRIPLAKLEPAKDYKKTDFHIAYPGFDYDIGIAWKVSEGVVISRQELSDIFLEALEFTRSRKLQRTFSQ